MCLMETLLSGSRLAAARWARRRWALFSGYSPRARAMCPRRARSLQLWTSWVAAAVVAGFKERPATLTAVRVVAREALRARGSQQHRFFHRSPPPSVQVGRAVSLVRTDWQVLRRAWAVLWSRAGARVGCLAR